MSNRQLEAAWQHLRLTLRDAVMEYLPSQSAHASGLPTAAGDPERVAAFIASVSSALERIGHEGEESPVLRTARMLFKPNPAHRTRKELLKAFEKYQAAWAATQTKKE